MKNYCVAVPFAAIICGLLLALPHSVCAEPASETTLQPTRVWENAPETELREEIDRLGEALREKVSAATDTKKKLDIIATDPKYTSATVEAKRKAIQEAETALIKARIELREEVVKLPEVQKIADDNKKLQSEIDALRLQMKDVKQILRKRTLVRPTGN